METGEFRGGLLAPRIKDVLEKKEELEKAKTRAEEVLRYEAADMADPNVVRNYVIDMRDLLTNSSITEQRSFLKSFVEKIEVGDSELKMYYTIPMPPNAASEETVGLVPFVHHGFRRGEGRNFERGESPLLVLLLF